MAFKEQYVDKFDDVFMDALEERYSECSFNNEDDESDHDYLLLMVLEDQPISESNSCKEDDLLETLNEIDGFRNTNKELEIKESSMVKKINMLRIQLKAINRGT